MRKVIMYIAIFLLIISCNKTFAATEEEMEEARNAVLEIIQAYYRKSVGVQYDSYRRNINFSPEDATPQSYIYTACSGYPHMVYNQAFGINTSPYTYRIVDNAFKFKDNSDIVILSLEGEENIYSVNGIGATMDDVDSVVNRWKNMVKIGDILVLDGFHAMIFGELDSNGEPYIYESTGARYDMNRQVEHFEINGSLKKITFRKILERYLNFQKTKRLVLVRYINPNNQYMSFEADASIKVYNGLTESAKSRLKYPKMDITKTSNIINIDDNNTRSSVALGDTIEYKIEIKNNSNEEYVNLKVTEVLDENVELLNSQDYNISDKTIIWNINSIPSGQTKIITYKVKVKEFANILGKYIVSTGYVDNIKNRTIKLFASESLNKTEQIKLLDMYESLKETSSKNDIDFIIELYNRSLGIDISFMSGKNFNDYVIHNGCSDETCKVYVNDSQIQRITLGNHYNIRMGEQTINTGDLVVNKYYSWYLNNIDDLTTRSRELMVSDFEIGDILIVRKETANNMTNKAYIYIGNGRLVRKSNSILEYSDGSNGRKAIQELLNDFNEDNYIVIRPAMLINRSRSGDITEHPQVVDVPNTLQTTSILMIISSILLLICGMFIIYRYKNHSK